MQVRYRPLRRSCCNSPFPNPYFRGRVVTNVMSTCDPTPLYYMQLNIIKKKKKKREEEKTVFSKLTKLNMNLNI